MNSYGVLPSAWSIFIPEWMGGYAGPPRGDKTGTICPGPQARGGLTQMPKIFKNNCLQVCGKKQSLVSVQDKGSKDD